MSYVAKSHVRVGRTVYVPGEFLPDNIHSDDLEWLIDSGSVISTEPLSSAPKVEEVPGETEENTEIDVMAGLVKEDPKPKRNRRKTK